MEHVSRNSPFKGRGGSCGFILIRGKPPGFPVFSTNWLFRKGAFLVGEGGDFFPGKKKSIGEGRSLPASHRCMNFSLSKAFMQRHLSFFMLERAGGYPPSLACCNDLSSKTSFFPDQRCCSFCSIFSIFSVVRNRFCLNVRINSGLRGFRKSHERELQSNSAWLPNSRRNG